MLKGIFLEIGVSTHLFLNQVLDEDLLRLIKSCGFSNLEIWGMRPHFDYLNSDYVEKIALLLQELDLKVTAVHAPFYAHVEQARSGQWLSLSDPDPIARKAAQAEILSLANALPLLNCSMLVVHPGGLYDKAERILRENVKESIQTLLEHRSLTGIKIALENINSELGTPLGVFQIIEELASPNLGMCLDLGHANLGGDVFVTLKKFAARIIHIHASDNNGQDDSHQIPFTGTIDWLKVAAALQKLNYSGGFSWELRSSDNSADVLSRVYAASGEVFPLFRVCSKNKT